jgi:hypothetical protein
MDKTESSRRLGLSREALTLLTNEVQSIRQKGTHFKVNEAKLGSAIIELFFSKYFEKERERIEKKFLDQRSLLKMMIDKAASEEDLSSTINDYLRMSKARGRKKSEEDPDITKESDAS